MNSNIYFTKFHVTKFRQKWRNFTKPKKFGIREPKQMLLLNLVKYETQNSW
jgi:hypothetical protein